jgi:hypothetical protein
VRYLGDLPRRVDTDAAKWYIATVILGINDLLKTPDKKQIIRSTASGGQAIASIRPPLGEYTPLLVVTIVICNGGLSCDEVFP